MCVRSFYPEPCLDAKKDVERDRVLILMSDETVLSYCGAASEELKLTYDEATVKYDAECNICPDNASCETIKYLSPGTALTTTCWTDDGGPVIGDT